MREILQQALDALKDTHWSQKNVDAIAALEAELAKPANEFHPDWDTLKPYHDRIAELEAQIAKPEYPDLRKAAEMALEALLDANNMSLMELSIDDAYSDEIEALRQALAQPEQEPIAWIKTDKENSGFLITLYEENGWTPLYTAPPKRDVALTDEGKTWQGLTDDEILSFVAFEPHPLMNKTSIIHAVQAKLREKNG